MRTLTIVLLIILNYANAHSNSAIPKVSIIGISESIPTDDPSDNIINLELIKSSNQGQVILKYEVWKSSDNVRIFHSVNYNYACENLNNIQSNKWVNQSIVLDKEFFQNGNNIIHFETNPVLQEHYKLRNVKIEETDLPNQVNFPFEDYSIKKSSLEKTSFDKSNNTFTNSSIEVKLDTLLNASKSSVYISSLNRFNTVSTGIDMSNVTENAFGYRIILNESASDYLVTLKYDQAQIPAGYFESDIRTYLFNYETKRWSQLKTVKIDKENNTIISIAETNGDVINSVIKVPESPEASAFIPTGIKDIQLADPASQIVQIQPPTANNMGSANLSFPIKIPPGRKGIQPSISLTYNSEGDNNSWCGLGWNLTNPKIAIDTRWGVPRYWTDKETETYNLNGAQLYPVSHRLDFEDRLFDIDASGNALNYKTFHHRVEGSFLRIRRYGANPKQYYWEVTTKTGVKYFYGGTPDEGLIDNAVIKDYQDNLAEWQLYKVIEPNGNFMTYTYDHHATTDVINGKQIYLSKIHYTSNTDGTDGKYEVRFIRDSEVRNNQIVAAEDNLYAAEISDHNIRPDVKVNARLAFKRVTEDLLKYIHVKFDGNIVRRYKLRYKPLEFDKTGLEFIEEIDKDNNLFYSHKFEYHNDILDDNGNMVFFADDQNWDAQNDNIRDQWIEPIENDLPIIGTIDGSASAISGNKNTSFGAGLAVTFGAIGDKPHTKKNTTGINMNYSYSNGKGMLNLIDINGDGLKDKVFINNNTVAYRLNQIDESSGSFVFGDRKEVSTNGSVNTEQIFRSSSHTGSLGIETNLDFYLGAAASHTWGKTKTYFADVNGDQFIDLVDEGKVYYSYFNNFGNTNPSDDIVTFTDQSSDTPSKIEFGAIDPAEFTLSNADTEEIKKQNPLYDIVRVFRAPKSGKIKISSTPDLSPDPERASYTFFDGVRLMIQHNDTELPATVTLNSLTPSQSYNINEVDVLEGDQIFFRTSSIEDGKHDEVSWNPIVEYYDDPSTIAIEVDANEKTANNLFYNKFDYGKELLLGGYYPFTVPLSGKIDVTGSLTKETPILTDELIVTIERLNPTPDVYETKVFGQTSAGGSITVSNEEVQAGDELIFKVFATTNVDWASIKWNPELTYSEIDQAQSINGQNITLSNESITQLKTETHYPQVFHTIYADEVYKQNPLNINSNFSAVPDLIISPNNENGSIIISVKVNGDYRDKKTINIINGQPSNSPSINSGPINSGDNILVEYHMFNRELALNVTQSNVIVNGNSMQVGLYTQIDDSERIFGNLYRNWGQFVYNGNDQQPIDRTKLTDQIDLSDIENQFNSIDLSGDISTIDPEGADAQNLNNTISQSSGSNVMFLKMYPNNEKDKWVIYDETIYISSSSLNSSRIGIKNINEYGPIPSGMDVRAVNKTTHTWNFSVAGNVPIGGVSGGGSVSYGWTKIKTDFLDMNGDRFPDIVGDNVQYTFPNGALGNQILPFGPLSDTRHFSAGLTAGGTFNKSKPSDSNGGQDNIQLITHDSTDPKALAGHSNLGGNAGYGNEDSNYNLIDINGDGLPDKVKEGGKVYLNLGYSFSPDQETAWDFDDIRDASSSTFGASLGFNIDNFSFAGGIGLSKSHNSVYHSFQDINGDGLIDLLFGDGIVENHLTGNIILPNDPIKVKLNTGSGYTNEIDWIGANGISEGSSTGESVNIAATFGIPISPTNKICLNPSSYAAKNASRENQSIQDINGDGYPDYLVSKNSDDLTIKLSTIGKTNKLKTIHRPLGSSIVLDYQRIGNTVDMPNSVWTMSSVEINDGFEDGITSEGSDKIVSTISYNNGYYDRHEREFYGFEEVKVSDMGKDANDNYVDVYRNANKFYNNKDFYKKGTLSKDHITDASQKLYVENNYEIVVKDIHSLTDEGCGFPQLKNTTKSFYEGGVDAVSTKMEFEYDDFGNISKYRDKGDSNDNTSDDLEADVDYWTEYLEAYYVGIPKSIEVNGKEFQSPNSMVYRKREMDIYPSTGNTKEIRHFFNDTEFTKHNFNYYPNGNLEILLRPENHNSERFEISFTYDPEVNTYVTEVKDSYDYTSKSEYSYEFGILTKSTDINNQEISYKLDNKGRIEEILGPYEKTDGKDYTIKFDYHPKISFDPITTDNISYAVTKHYDTFHPNDNIETTVFVDGLGRKIQVKKDAAIYDLDAGSLDEDKQIVSGRLVFDEFGRNTHQYYPTTDGLVNFDKFFIAHDGEEPLKIEYDILDRPTLITLQDNASTTGYDYTISKSSKADPTNQIYFFKTSTKDPNDHYTHLFTDVRNRKRLSTLFLNHSNPQPSDPIHTIFRYNAINELKTVDDHDGNTVSYFYDILGRLTQREHPDAGIIENEYDKASNLIVRHTSNTLDPTYVSDVSTGITYEYDFERLKNIRYPKFPEHDVFYQYGEMTETLDKDHNRMGRIKFINNQFSSESYEYGLLGEVIKEDKKLVTPGVDQEEYTTRWTYDTWNRVIDMIYDDGELVKYTYNKGGLVNGLTGLKLNNKYQYVDDIGYDKFEKRNWIQYGNRTSTEYEFEADRRRLINVISQTSTDDIFINYTYDYDNTINIESLINNVSNPPRNSLGGPSSFFYEYDDIYRLTESTGYYSSAIDRQKYSLSLGYDKIHNIDRKELSHVRITPEGNQSEQQDNNYRHNYDYASSNGPHQLKRITTGTNAINFNYDPNGNVTEIDDKKYAWDEENRLVSFRHQNEDINFYIYDHAGQRIFKIQDPHKVRNNTPEENFFYSGKYTTYVNPFYVDRAAGATKHFYIGSERILSKLSTGGATGLAGTYSPNVDNDPLKDYKTYINSQSFQDRPASSSDVDSEYNSNHDDWVNAERNADASGTPITYPDATGDTDAPVLSDSRNTRELNQFFYHSNHIGNSNFITNYDGQIHQHFEYMPHGELFVDDKRPNENFDLPYRFNGKEFDENTGLYYYGTRYHSPKFGIFISSDPLSDKFPGLNSYSYPFNNPIIYIDPEGEDGELTIRLWGVAQTVWGGLEVAGGTILLGAPEPTLITKGLGSVAVIHGTDNFTTGVLQAWSGKEEITFTQQFFHSIGLSKAQSEYADMAIGMATGTAGSYAKALKMIRLGGITRQNYHTALAGLKSIGDDMLSKGHSYEDAVRLLVPSRNNMKALIRKGDDLINKSVAEFRNFIKYGNKLGPSIDDMIKKYTKNGKTDWKTIYDKIWQTSETFDKLKK